mgnify:CR=1 FL=1
MAVGAAAAHLHITKDHVTPRRKPRDEAPVAHARGPAAGLDSGGAERHHEVAPQVGVQPPPLEGAQRHAVPRVGVRHLDEERTARVRVGPAQQQVGRGAAGDQAAERVQRACGE